MSDETTVAVAAAAEPEAAPERWPSRRVLAWLCGVFLLGALVLAVVAGQLSARLADERGDRDDVTRVAARMGSALLTYDHRDLDATRQAVLALATGGFEEEYQQVFPGLQELYGNLQASSRVVDVEVFVSDIEGGQAAAVVSIVAEAQGLAGTRGQRSVVVLDLVEVEGRGWLVSKVSPLEVGQPLPTAPAPPTTEGGRE